MSRRWRLKIGLVLIVTVGVVFLLPAIRWRLIGWARGEAFYQGRPTSYWEAEIRQYRMVDAYDWVGGLEFAYPEPTPPEKWLWNYLHLHIGRDPNFVHPTSMDSAAISVLVELLECEDGKVQLFAVQNLGYIGPAARPAWPKLTELARTTQEYLIYQEARHSLINIDWERAIKAGLDRHDGNQLFARYRAGVGLRYAGLP